MYIPASFAESDSSTLHDLMRRHSFATIVTAGAGPLFATHVPFLVDATHGPHGTLLGHMARANPHWRCFDGGEALVIFQGPHGYVSPAWYADGANVPTWNYAVVHAYGTPEIVEDEAAARAVIERTVATYESTRAEPWSTAELPPPFVEKLLQAIVAFRIPIARLEGKLKLSQNKSAADRQGVIAALRAAGNAEALALAELMATV